MRDGIHVRYIGEGVREVAGIGVFQKDTVAWVPRDIALEILKEDCFVAASSGRPVSALVIRLGQKPSHAPNPSGGDMTDEERGENENGNGNESKGRAGK